MTLLIVGCLGKAGPSYKLYPGPVLPPADLAVVKFGKGLTSLRVDGMRVDKRDYGSIELLPGSYLLEWRSGSSASPTVGSDGSEGIFASTRADLEAGHEYTVNSHRPIFASDTTRWWLTDTTTGIELESGFAR